MAAEWLPVDSTKYLHRIVREKNKQTPSENGWKPQNPHLSGPDENVLHNKGAILFFLKYWLRHLDIMIEHLIIIGPCLLSGKGPPKINTFTVMYFDRCLLINLISSNRRDKPFSLYIKILSILISVNFPNGFQVVKKFACLI